MDGLHTKNKVVFFFTAITGLDVIQLHPKHSHWLRKMIACTFTYLYSRNNIKMYNMTSFITACAWINSQIRNHWVCPPRDECEIYISAENTHRCVYSESSKEFMIMWWIYHRSNFSVYTCRERRKQLSLQTTLTDFCSCSGDRRMESSPDVHPQSAVAESSAV